jgi:hypothetical protein
MSESVERNPDYTKAFNQMHRRNAIKHYLRRSGCCVMVAVWVVLLLMPCFFVTLVVRKEIIISRSDIPEHEYRIFLLENEDERGFGLSRGSIKSGGEDEDAACVITHTDYLLWEGEGEDAVYCSCYEKFGDEWSAVMVGGDAECQPIEFEFDE